MKKTATATARIIAGAGTAFGASKFSASGLSVRARLLP